MPACFMFDAYGTLFDVHAAIGRHRDAAGPDADRLSTIWRQKQLEYSWTLTLAGRYVDFWSVTEQALDYALALVPAVDRSLRPRLLDAYRTLGAYADARTTLEALKQRGERSAILSNGSEPMLAMAVEAAGLAPFLDAVLSVDRVRVYKPRREVYEFAAQSMQVDPADVTFVSSNRWDVMGAATFGFRPVWINRAASPDEYADAPPFAVLSDLRALLDLPS